MCPLGIYNLNGIHSHAGFPIALYYELVLQIHIVRNNWVESQWMQSSLEMGIQGREIHLFIILNISWKLLLSIDLSGMIHMCKYSRFTKKGTVWKMARKTYRWNYKKKNYGEKDMLCVCGYQFRNRVIENH